MGCDEFQEVEGWLVGAGERDVDMRFIRLLGKFLSAPGNTPKVRANGEDGGAVAVSDVPLGALDICRPGSFLEAVFGRDAPGFGASAFRAPSSMRDPLPEGDVETGPVGSGLAAGNDTLDAGWACQDVGACAHDVSIHQYAPGVESFTFRARMPMLALLVGVGPSRHGDVARAITNQGMGRMPVLRVQGQVCGLVENGAFDVGVAAQEDFHSACIDTCVKENSFHFLPDGIRAEVGFKPFAAA